MYLERKTFLAQLFPGAEIRVGLEKSAALRLLKLLERYNWALSEPEKYQRRWRQFWPVLSSLERTVLVMYVRSNNGGKFQGKVCLQQLQAELAGEMVEHQWNKPSAEAAHEFAAIRHIFVQAFIDPEDLVFKWYETHRELMQAHERAVRAALKKWWDGCGAVELRDALLDALCVDGLFEANANVVASDMALQGMYVIHGREDAVFDSIYSENAPNVVLH